MSKAEKAADELTKAVMKQIGHRASLGTARPHWPTTASVWGAGSTPSRSWLG
jgi:hypothetical protein